MKGGNPIETPLMYATNSFKTAARSAPESVILLAVLILVVVWATRAGSLPGGGMHFLGAMAEGVSWACLYAGLFMAYSQVSLKEWKSARRLLRRLGLCLLLAVILTHICSLLVSSVAWDKFFHLRYLSPPAFLGFWCAALLPKETVALYRTVKTTKVIAPLLPIAILLVAAAYLVTGSDLAMQFGVPSESGIKGFIIQKNAWVTNILILFSAYALAFAVTSKYAIALLFVSPFYVVLCLASIEKLKYMHEAVSPLDLISIPEFLPLFQSFFGTGVLVCSVCVFIAWIVALVVFRRIEPCRIPLVFRCSLMVFSLVVLLAVPIMYARVLPPNDLELHRRIGAPEFFLTETKEITRKSGVLLTFMAEIPLSLFFPPPDYSSETVALASRSMLIPDVVPTDLSLGRRVNLIVYMVESFMYPEDLGWHYTSDPIPNMQAIKKSSVSGYSIVPKRFGGSANSEFEALTGMTMFFLPEHSLPYRQFVKRPIPSLPGALKHLGYRTMAVQADPKNYYNREPVYSRLGFDELVWLHEGTSIERAAQGWWPSDNALVENVIQASRSTRPFFIFAFPSSTHSPYHSGVYRNSDLGVLDSLPGDAAGEVKEYINALRIADRAIGTLIDYFQHQTEPTMIAIVGDHLPPLSVEAYHSFNANLSGMSKAEQAWKARAVPLLVWTNFGLPREKVEISLNALPSYLLEKMGIKPQGFLAMTNAVRLNLPILSGGYIRGSGGSVWDRDSLPPKERAMVDDYQLLQYDLLLGMQCSLR
jgi:hypothetical protein